LEAELAETLELLSRRAPSRPEVWLRLSRARRDTEAPFEEVRDALVSALAAADSGSETRREALVGLADIDLAQGDGARAQLWLDRVADERSADVSLRRAEASLLLGDAATAKKILDATESLPTDGRAALARGRALARLADPTAFVPLLRAMVLDVPGSSEALSSALAYVPSDPQTRTRVRSVVDAKGEQALARWRAAFARAEGARDAARRALREALDAGDKAAAGPLLDAAIEDRETEALHAALVALPPDACDPLIADARLFERAFLTSDRGVVALDVVALVAHPRLTAWVNTVVDEISRAWVPPSGTSASWPLLLGRLQTHAHGIGDLRVAVALGELATERARPVRLAIVGEFNAGKSTFINALIGAEVTPTGVLPTTATLHHLRWAPDPFAKILFIKGSDPAERIVAPADLRSLLDASDPSAVRRVEIGLPIPSLVRVEILDTPGFNAQDPEHARVARSAFEEADVAVWLLDATQAIKQSERAVLEEAKRTGLPVQFLVNKTDRLAPPEIDRVLAGVRAGLAQIGVESFTSPLAFSAKRALAGRLGDTLALGQSGFTAVEQLIEDQIVGRSSELKEKALRRRAGSLVRELIEGYVARRQGEEATSRDLSVRAEAAAHSAARIEGQAHAIESQLVASLKPHAQAWAHDLDRVFVGRDPQNALVDPVLARYRVDRALAGLSPALSTALVSLAPEAAFPPDQLGPYARAIVRTAASCGPMDLDEMLLAIARSALATLTEMLLVFGGGDHAPTKTAGTLRELEAFERALR
jgi:GTP-binding protein EngB required for normal cell division